MLVFMPESPTEPPVPGLPTLDDDTLASVVAAVQAGGRLSGVAAMATTCTAMATALKEVLRARKERTLEALTQRLGWTDDTLAGAQILHSTGQHISDADLLLLELF